jgi:hypothetical protein
VRIFLNSRGFEQDKDYRWVEFKLDNSIKESRDFWTQTPISTLPFFDEYSLSIGTFPNGETFFLATHLQSSRTDAKGREIRNSILLVSHIVEDIRQIALSFIFRGDEIERELNSLIVESENEFGFDSEHIQIKPLLEKYSRDYNVDLHTEASSNIRFGKLYFRETVEKEVIQEIEKSEDGEVEEVTKVVKEDIFKPNEVLFNELKKVLQGEDFKEREIHLIYTPFLSKNELVQSRAGLALAKDFSFELEKEIESDIEAFHEVEIVEPKVKKFFSNLFDFRYEIVSVVLLVVVLIPLSLSYLHLNSKIQSVVTDSQYLKAQNIKLSNINRLVKQRYMSIKTEKESLYEKLTTIDNENVLLKKELAEFEEREQVLLKEKEELSKKLNYYRRKYRRR